MSDLQSHPEPATSLGDTSREEYWRAERQAAYDTAKGDHLLLSPWRRFTTLDREICSWPLFIGWTVVVGVAYYLAGWGYWDFRDPLTGDLDWLLVGVFWLISASVVWLCWPLPKAKGSGGGSA